MSSGLLQLGADVAMLMDGRAVIDWKDDKIIKVEDATLQDWLKFVTYEAQKVLPISASNYQNSRRRGAGWLMALATSILGVRFSRTEEDIRIREHWSDFYRLRKDRDEMYRYIGTLDRPMKTVTEWNDQIDKIMGEPGVPAEIKQRLKPLRIDLNGYVKRQQAQAKAGKLTPSQIRKLESLTENLTNEQKRKKR